MGPSKPFRPIDRQLEQAREFFEPTLERLGLSVASIEKQTLTELQQSLERVNEAIAKPESFGTLHIQISSSAGVGFIVTTGAETHVEVGILPILLERKRLIIDRIGNLSSEQSVAALKGLISQVSDSTIRQQLSEKVESFGKESEQIRAEAADAEAQKADAMIVVQAELVKAQAFEKRAGAWLRILGRESMASVVGAVLVLLLGVALVIAMFARIGISSIVGDSFLLILGYFFGQGTRQKPSAPDSGS